MPRWRALGALGLALAATVGLYVATSATSGHVGPGRYRDGRGRLGREGLVSAATTAVAGFFFTPSSSSLTEDLCSTFSSELTGPAAFCVHGDGGYDSNGLTLAAVGSPAAKTLATCPNGSDCTAVAAEGTGQLSGFQTANADSGFGDVSWWFVTRKSGPDTASTVAISKYSASVPTQRSFLMGINGSHLPTYAAFTDAGATVGSGVTCQTGFVAPEVGWSSVVATYTAADSKVRIYIDGQACITFGPTQAPLSLATMPFTVGSSLDGGTAGIDQDFRVAGQTEKVVTLKAIRDFSSAATGSLSGTAGEPILTDRGALALATGNIACAAASDGTLSTLGVTQPCVAGGYLWSNKASTNLIYKGSELNGWAAGGDGVLTAGAGTDPLGTTKASLLSAGTTSTGFRYANGGIVALAAATAHTYSVYAAKKDVRYIRVDADGNYAMFDLNDGTVANSSGCTYESVAVPRMGALAWRLSIHFTSSGSGSTQLYVFQTSDPNNASYAGTAGQGTYLFGAQLETGSVTTPLVYAPGPTATTGSTERSRTAVATAFTSTPTTLAATTKTANVTQSAYLLDVTTQTQRVAALRLDAGVPLCTWGGVDGGSQSIAAAGALTANTAQALTCSWLGDGGVSLCVDAACVTAAQTVVLPALPCSLSLGSNNFSFSSGWPDTGDSFAGGLKAVSVTGAPKKTLTRLGVLGDSISSINPRGSYADAWPRQMFDRQRTNFVTYDSAQGFFTSALVRTDEWPDMARWSPNYVAVLAGVNDLQLLGRTPSAILADLQTTYSNIAAAGATPVLITLTPWRGSASWSAGLQTDTDTLNTSIRNVASDAGWPLCDAALQLSDGGQGYSPPYAGPDFLHPNDAGEYALYVCVLSALDGGAP